MSDEKLRELIAKWRTSERWHCRACTQRNADADELEVALAVPAGLAAAVADQLRAAVNGPFAQLRGGETQSAISEDDLNEVRENLQCIADIEKAVERVAMCGKHEPATSEDGRMAIENETKNEVWAYVKKKFEEILGPIPDNGSTFEDWLIQIRAEEQERAARIPERAAELLEASSNEDTQVRCATARAIAAAIRAGKKEGES